MKSQILDFCEVAVSLFHQKRFFFVVSSWRTLFFSDLLTYNLDHMYLFQQALNIDTKRPSISLTVPGAIDSLPSATGIASKPSEALTKPGQSLVVGTHIKFLKSYANPTH
jgi:hypothetical protein